MKKVICILMLFCSVTVYAQSEVGNDFLIVTSDSTSEFQKTIFKRRVIVPAKSIIFNAGYSIPFLHNDLVKSDYWAKNLGSAASFEVDFRKQFQKDRTEDGEIIKVPTLWAIGMGLSVNYYTQSAEFTCDSVVKLPGLIDADGDMYEAHLDYKEVKESVSLTYISLPLYLEIGKLNQVKTSAFVRVGVKASLLISDNFSGEGRYTSTGYYDKPKKTDEPWNVMLDDIPPLNFYNDAPCYDNPEYKASPFVLWGTISGGINIPFSSLEKNRVSDFILRIGAKAEYSLTKVSKASSEPYFTGAPCRINQANMLGGSGSRILAVGLELGLVYCL